MRVAVVGAGNMGSWLVESLCLDYEVGVYDSDRSKLKYFLTISFQAEGIPAFDNSSLILKNPISNNLSTKKSF